MRRLAVPGQGALCVGIPGSADSRPCRSGTVIAQGQGMGWGSQAADGGQGRAGPCQWRGWWGSSWILETPDAFPPLLPCGVSTLSHHPEVGVEGPTAERGPVGPCGLGKGTAASEWRGM